MRVTHLIIALSLFSVACADSVSGPGRTTLVEESWGAVYCAEGCQVVMVDVNRWRVDSPRGPVSIQRRSGGWLIQAVNQNLRVDEQEGGFRFLYNAAQFQLQKTPTSTRWTDPSGEVLDYRVEAEGKLVAEGPKGEATIVADPVAGKFRVTSAVGETKIDTKRQTVEGIPLNLHPNLTPGVLLDNEVVGVYVRLPARQALPMLGWSQAITVASIMPFRETVQTVAMPKSDPLNLGPKPFESAPTIEESLRKKPGNDWTYPDGAQQTPKEPMQSIQAPKGVDPFKPVSAPKGTNPLQAQGANKGQDPLNLNRKPFSKQPSMFDTQRESRGALPPP